MINQETLKHVKAMDIDFGEGQTLRGGGLLEDMELEIRRKDEIIVKDNRHINKLDKENEANKQRIAVLKRALAKAVEKINYIVDTANDLKCVPPPAHKVVLSELIRQVESEIEREQGK